MIEIGVRMVDDGDTVNTLPNVGRFDRHAKADRVDVLAKLGFPILGDIAPPVTICAAAIGHAQARLATAIAAHSMPPHLSTSPARRTTSPSDGATCSTPSVISPP